MGIIVDDPFEEASNTDLDLHTPNVAGDQWVETERTGVRKIRVFSTPDLASQDGNEQSDRAIYTSRPNPTSVEYDVQFTVPGVDSAGDDPCHVVARLTDTSNYYFVKFDSVDQNEMEMFRREGGINNSIGTSTTPLAASDVVRFGIRDATKKIFVNAVEEISSTDNELTSAGSCGIAVGNLSNGNDDIVTAWSFDDYTVDEIAAAGAAPKGPFGMPLSRPLRGPL